MLMDPIYVFLAEVSVQVLCLFFNWIVCLPGVESCEFCIYFGDQTFVQGITGKYYAKGNKPGSERQIPYNLTYKRNLMNKMN